MKQILKRKEASVLENTLVALVGLVISIAILTVVISAFSNISDKWTMRQVARETMLKMETEGYLDSASQGELLFDLGELGLSDISLSDTTTSEVGYGGRIVLNIRGKYQNKSLDFAGGISKIINKPSDVYIRYESTAKQ